MTPLERLLAEELPTGTFGGARPDVRRRGEPLPPVTRADADRNWADLAAAIGETPLRPVPDQSEAA